MGTTRAFYAPRVGRNRVPCIIRVVYALLPENGHGKQAQLVACGVGGSAFRFVGFPKCPACGGPPWTYDIDLRVPADMTPGAKTFPVWVIDGEGHRADTTATIEIVRR